MILDCRRDGATVFATYATETQERETFRGKKGVSMRGGDLNPQKLAKSTPIRRFPGRFGLLLTGRNVQ